MPDVFSPLLEDFFKFHKHDWLLMIAYIFNKRELHV